MTVLDRVHGQYVHTRRVRVLGDHVAALLPQGARVLDVGCGDGLLAASIQQARSDLEITGIDVLVRAGTHIPVEPFDGRTIPYADRSVDVVTFVDVLHHADDAGALLREASRVARRAIVIKDHLREGLLAGTTLRLMDWVGNARYGVALPYNYWRRQEWLDASASLGLTTSAWREALGIYPWPATWLFDRSLHFIARFDVPARQHAAA